MSELKEGDVVMLKSGGPKMTIGKINNDGTADSYWFTDESYLHTGKIAGDSLALPVDAKLAEAIKAWIAV